jgi:hypothetical protein
MRSRMNWHGKSVSMGADRADIYVSDQCRNGVHPSARGVVIVRINDLWENGTWRRAAANPESLSLSATRELLIRPA